MTFIMLAWVLGTVVAIVVTVVMVSSIVDMAASLRVIADAVSW